MYRTAPLYLNRKEITNRRHIYFKQNQIRVDREFRTNFLLMMIELGYPTFYSLISSENTTRSRFMKFVETSSIVDWERSWRRRTASTERNEEIVEVFTNSPVDNVCIVFPTVHVSKSILHRVVCRVSNFKAYKRTGKYALCRNSDDRK